MSVYLTHCLSEESVLKVFSFSLHPLVHASISAPFYVDWAGLVLAPALVEGGILVPTLAAGAEAGGRGPSLRAVLARALRGGPGLAHPEGPGLDHDPDLALSLSRGADQALLGDPGLVLQPGAFANLERHLQNKVALLLKAPAEARAQNETTEDPSAIFSFFLSFLSLYHCLHLFEIKYFFFFPSCLHDQHGHCLLQYK